MAVYFFYGDEDYNIELELSKMSSKLNPEASASGVASPATIPPNGKQAIKSGM